MYKPFLSDLPSVRISVLPSQSNDIPLTLYCDMESFYPEDISVSFLQNGTVLPEPPATEQNLDGTYRTRRYYTLSSSQREQGGPVECAAYQPGAKHAVRSSVNLDNVDLKGKTGDKIICTLICRADTITERRTAWQAKACRSLAGSRPVWTTMYGVWTGKVLVHLLFPAEAPLSKAPNP